MPRWQLHVNMTLVDRNTTLRVEAVEQSIHLDVIRSLGTVGVVSVDVITQSGSAVGQVGPDLHLSYLQSVRPARQHNDFFINCYLAVFVHGLIFYI